jgi:hypothetical protein
VYLFPDVFDGREEHRVRVDVQDVIH